MLRLVVLLLTLVLAPLAPGDLAGAADLPSYDEPIGSALVLLAGSSATNHLPPVLEANRVSIEFVPMAPGVYARYSVTSHVIEIDSRWQDAAPATLAAVIAHEATHAQDAVSGYLSAGGGAACLDSEIRAFRTSALFWLDLYGPDGKPGTTDELEHQLNLIAERQVRDPAGLEALVRQTYRGQCAV